MSAFFKILRILFGLTFIAAAVSKAAFPAEFATVVANYQILPESLVNPVALVLPWLELVCGAALVTGVFTRAAALILTLLLAVFMAALWYNVSRGLSVGCGCFTVAPEAGESMREALVRDVVLLVAGVVVFGHALWAERRRVASVTFWLEFHKPRKSAFGEPEVQNGVLFVGSDEAPVELTETQAQKPPQAMAMPGPGGWELENNGEKDKPKGD